MGAPPAAPQLKIQEWRACRILAERQISCRWDLLSERPILRIRHDAHNFDRIAKVIRLAHAIPPADRIRAAEILPGHGLINNRDEPRCRSIVAVEITAGENRDSERFKVSIAHPVEMDRCVVSRFCSVAIDHYFIRICAVADRRNYGRADHVNARNRTQLLQYLAKHSRPPLRRIVTVSKVYIRQ